MVQWLLVELQGIIMLSHNGILMILSLYLYYKFIQYNNVQVSFWVTGIEDGQTV